jgi:hypothetical protein
MNINLIIFTENDGRFVRYITCSEDTSSAQASQGEIAANANGKTYAEAEYTYYDIQTNLVVDMPPKPGEWFRFDYQLKQWVIDEYSAGIEAKRTRQLLLQQSDWTDTASAPERLGSMLYDQWQEYRQTLRDITEQTGYPINIVWPIPPT